VAVQTSTAGVSGVTGSGISSVTTEDVTVSTTTGTAVSLSSVGGTLSFTSVSSNGAANGILLTNTTGSFTVTGDGANTSLGGNSSGGSILASTGSTGTNGVGIALVNAQNVTLQRVNVSATDLQGILVRNSTGFKLEYSKINGATSDAIMFDKPNAGTVTGTVHDTTIGTAAVTNSGSLNGNGIFLATVGTGSIGLTIENNDIRQVRQNAGISALNTGGAFTVDLKITGNTIGNLGTGAPAGILVGSGSPGEHSVTVCAAVTGNDVHGTGPGGAGDIQVYVGDSDNLMRLPGLTPSSGASQAQIQSFLVTSNNFAGTDAEAFIDAGAAFGSAYTGAGTCTTP
jgi:hypothetical protein